MRSLTELQLHALSIEIPSSSLALAEVRIARTRHVIVDGKNDVFEACVSWENELKVKVQVQGTLRLLLGSYFGFLQVTINSGSANDEYCSTFVFFTFSTASKLTSTPDVFINEAA